MPATGACPSLRSPHQSLTLRHILLPIRQESDLDTVVRQRIRSLRKARGWSLDNLATRADISASQLSRIETGHRRISLDQLAVIATALGQPVDQLVESPDDSDIVIRPHRDEQRGLTTWLLSHADNPDGTIVAKMRITAQSGNLNPDDFGVHPGRDWLTVLSGTVVIYLGSRIIRVETGQAASFSTMTPHAIRADRGPAEALCILSREGQRSHLGPET